MRPAAVWFARLWGVGIVAHLLANPAVGRDGAGIRVAAVVGGAAAIGLVLRPSDRRLLGLVSGLTLVHAFLEAPFIGNHWVLAAAISVAILVSLAQPDPWAWFAPTARWMLLGFYAWAAFNKLNAGFFDPTTSCGLAYTNQLLGSWGLPLVPAGGGAAVASAAGTALVELSVPVLLMIPRTRRWGVMLGMAFHGLISFDLDQHFFDFTSLLLALFGLFLADETAERLDGRVRLSGWVKGLVAGTLGVLVVVASVAPVTLVTIRLLETGMFVTWIPFLTWVLAAVFIEVVIRGGEASRELRLPSPGRVPAAVLVGLVVLNGLTPYLELKTGYGWNMYANLVTAGGESNHFVIRRTFPLTDGNADPVMILATDDLGLAAYIDSGWALPERNLRHYLADRPEATVTYEQAGVVRTGTGAELGERLPLWSEKLQLFRSIETRRPPRCQLVWLPAW